MWPCPDCGEMLDTHALGCEACGSDFMNETCPVCKVSISQFATSCPECSYDLTQIGDWRLRPPYPFFGGKRRVVEDVWKLLRQPKRYIEPFLGSAAVLINRPFEGGRIHCVVNDKNRYISNFWRAVQFKPKQVAKWCDWPVNEADLHSRHAWLETQPFEERMVVADKDLLKRLWALEGGLKSDPLWYDARIAGWWAGVKVGGLEAVGVRARLGKRSSQSFMQAEPRPRSRFQDTRASMASTTRRRLPRGGQASMLLVQSVRIVSEDRW
jgi:D12 class N6 adenine-specific DNA methyltransferase